MNILQSIVHTFADKIFLSLIDDNRYTYIIHGLGYSLLITVIAAVIGVVLGLLIAICRMRGKGILYSIAYGYIAVIRGTPAVVQLTVIYFVIFGSLLGSLKIPPFLIAGLSFGLNSAAYVSEIIRSGITAVNKGQMEAGRSLGLSYAKCMRFIIIPQAVKNVLPALGNEFITLIKETAVAGYIGISDLNMAGEIISGATYEAMVPFLVVAFIYFLMTTMLAGFLFRFERRLHRND